MTPKHPRDGLAEFGAAVYFEGAFQRARALFPSAPLPDATASRIAFFVMPYVDSIGLDGTRVRAVTLLAAIKAGASVLVINDGHGRAAVVPDRTDDARPGADLLGDAPFPRA